MIGLDTNCVTFLVEAMSPGTATSKSKTLDDQRLALFRTFLYQKELFRLLPAVEAECQEIGDAEKKRIHYLVYVVNMIDVLNIKQKHVESLQTKFLRDHSSEKDCRILAEAEAGGLQGLVSFDSDFRKRLNGKSPVAIMSPTEYWDSLGILKGSTPNRVPDPTNPMASATFWRW